MNRIITISRQFGSAGNTIGKEVAAKLGIPYYNQELIEKAAEESGFTKEYISRNSESVSQFKFSAGTLSGFTAGQVMTNQDYIWAIQCKLIKEYAEKSPCVIIGRCADYILRDKADLLRVFIHADLEERTKRIVELYGETKESPEKRIRDKDKNRSEYYYFYTDMKWGAVQNYDVALNSSRLGIDKCIDTIVSLY